MIKDKEKKKGLGARMMYVCMYVFLDSRSFDPSLSTQ